MNFIAISLIGALSNCSYHEYKERKMTGGKWVWNENRSSFFVHLKQIVWQLQQNISMKAFSFWFDSNKELNYPILGMRVYKQVAFFIHDTAQILYGTYVL